MMAVNVQIPVPQNRMTPLKAAWMDLYKTVTGNLKLDMRMNLKTRKARLLRATCSISLHCCFAFIVRRRALSGNVCRNHSRVPFLQLATLQVEIKTTSQQRDTGLLQKAADLVHGYILGAGSFS